LHYSNLECLQPFRYTKFRIARSGGEKIVLSVADDGVGVPPDTKIGDSAGVGLSLVELLTKQLKATLEMDKGENGTGVLFTIEIPFEGSSIE